MMGNGTPLPTNPYGGPKLTAERRHGPAYSTYESYRPWLRDEFDYRCAYCLHREMFVHAVSDHVIDHFLPKSIYPDLSAAYGNLVYSCRPCNEAKQDKILLVIDDDLLFCGESGLFTPENHYLVQALGLNEPVRIRHRRKLIYVLKMLVDLNDLTELESYLGYPADLPDLRALRPESNTKPEGIAESAYVRREQGLLARFY